MCETSHRRDRIDPMYLTNAHRAHVTNEGCAEGFLDLCLPFQRRQLSAGTCALLTW